MKRLDRDGGIEVVLRVAGTMTELARSLGVARNTVVRWDKIPVARVPEVARLYGLERWELRPDIWPPPRQRSEKRGRPRRHI